MTEVTYTRQDDPISCFDIFRRPDPLHFVAALLDCIDQGADVAGDIVEKVDFWHGCRCTSKISNQRKCAQDGP